MVKLCARRVLNVQYLSSKPLSDDDGWTLAYYTRHLERASCLSVLR